MTFPTSAAPIRILDDGYVPGVCNIGPWEIRRRRAIAVIAFAIGLVALAILVAAGAPAALRLVLVLPFWSGALSWLQARRHFCAGFAMGGLSNFGDGAATRQQVTDPEAHRRDMLAVMRMTRDSFAIGAVLALATVLIPR
jgi:hypothetical protein